MAQYVYGIMRTDDAGGAVQAARAVRSARQVGAVEHRGVSALVSGIPDGELKLQRDAILAHSDVLQAAFEHGPVLPFRFGTVVAGAETVVAELLAPNAEGLAARLDGLDGKVEMQVKAVYREEPLLRSILVHDPALRRSVQRTQGMPAAATHFERMRIGEAIAAAVQSRQAADQRMLLEALAPLALAHSVSTPHHERAVLNAGFLVAREDLAAFDQAVEATCEERGDEIEFRLIGPLPPYSFADRDLGSLQPSRAGARWA